MKKKLHSILQRMLVRSMAIMLLALCFTSVKAQVSPGDSLALVEIYNLTNGSSWTSKNNWLTGNVSTWEGITLKQRRVTELKLPSNNLTGSLPYHIGFLQELQSLNLSGNKLQGNIPMAIVFLQKLKSLNLSENKFAGSIPASIGFLCTLTDLNLSKNLFVNALPSSLLLLTKLRKLDLSNNQISGHIPASIGVLKNLEGLYLSNNKLEGTVPSSLGYLKKVTNLYVDNNALRGTLPSSLGDIDSLVFFSIANNKISGNVPATVTKLSRLYYFNISGNQIVDLHNLSAMTSLFQFIVASNKLTFADIQPNLSRMLPGSYIPQDSVGNKLSVTACIGDSIRLSGNVIEHDPNNKYIWFSIDGSFVSDESSTPDLVFPQVTASDAKTYSLAIYNANVPDLYLYRRNVTLKTASCKVKGAAAAKESTVIYPVPFENAATLEVPAASNEALRITVRDESGLIVEQAQSSTNVKNSVGAELKKGTYYIESSHGDTRDIVRVIKK